MEKKLRTVDIVLSGSINAIIGPVGTLKRILKNQEYFNSRGYEVTVFTSDSINIGPIKEPPAPVAANTITQNKLRRKLSSFLREKAKKHLMIAKWYLEREREEIEQLVDYYVSLNRNPDIIQFHSSLECMFYLQKRNNVTAKTIMFWHSDGIPLKMTLEYYPCLEGTNYLKKWMADINETVSNTDRVCFIAKIGQENFLSYYPNRSKNDTCVIINGIDDLSSEQKEEVKAIRVSNNKTFKYRLCCTGTINFRKGQRIIIEALNHLPEDILKQIHLDLIGDGGERPVLEELVREYGLDEHVHFYGLIPNMDVYKYLAPNNIYILMSKNEGLPISIIEAMRVGLPAISTRVSGIPELIKENYNGVLLEPDKNELRNLLKNITDYDWEEMGNNSRIRFEKEFTFDRMMKEFCDLYDSLSI